MPSLLPFRTLPKRAKGRILWSTPAKAIRRDIYWGRWQLRRLWRRNLARKVDFVIAGASRSGTTALHTYLKQHPEVCLADIKEVHFFDEHLNFFPPGRGYAAYHIFFSPRPGHKVIGEGRLVTFTGPK